MKTVYFLPVLLISLWCKAQDGLYPYAEKGKWGLTNKKHAVVLEPQFDSIQLFQGDYARVENNRKVGLINGSGKIIYPCTYNDMPIVAPNGMAVAKTIKGYILLDPATGKQKGSLVFDEIPSINPLSKATNLLVVKKEGTIGLVDMNTGNLVNKTLKFDDGEFFEEPSLKNFLIVALDGKYGVIETSNGKEVIPATYGEIKSATDGSQDLIKAITDDERVVYFDASGKVAPASVAKAAQKVEESTNHDAAALEGSEEKKDMRIYKIPGGKWRVVIEIGEFQRPGRALDSVEFNGYSTLEYLSYREAQPIPGMIKAVKDNNTGVIDLKGNVIVPLIYDDVKYREDNFGHYAFIETRVGNRVGIIPVETMKELKKPVLAQVIDEDVNRKALLVQTAGGTRGYMDKTTGEIYIPGYRD